MELKAISLNKARNHGKSLPSTMMGIAISGIVIATVASMFASSMRSFRGFENQFSLDSQSRSTLDRLSKELRQIKQITSFSPNSMTFLNGTNQISIFHDADQRKVFRDSNNTAEVLLYECDSLELDMFSRVANSGTGYSLTSTPDMSQCRVLQVAWQCSKPTIGGTNSIYSQSAQIVLRN